MEVIMDELSNIIELTDENGDVIEFEFLDLIEYDNAEYVVLLPVEDDGSGEVVILKVEPTDDHEVESYCAASDEELAAVFEIFREKFKEEFNFID